MRRGKLLAARRVTVVAAFALSTCAAGQVVSPPFASAQVTRSYATAVAVGFNHACAIVGARAYCWGGNDNGQLGLPPSWVTGGIGSSNTPVAVGAPLGGTPGTNVTAISAGYDYTCALAQGGGAYCWGRNNSGELGNGSTTGAGAGPGVPTLVVDNHTFSQISTNDFGANAHTCAIQPPGSVWCWGNNSRGQLGDGTTTTRPSPVLVGGVLSGRAVTRIAVGSSHTCAVDSFGLAYCWGDNTGGKLGCAPPGTGACPALGSFSNVPVPVPAPPSTPPGAAWAEITAGDSHTCALDNNGVAYCWGNNQYGQVGDGTMNNTRPAPVQVSPPAGLPTVTAWKEITAGTGFTCAIAAAPPASNGKAYCWGDNSRGQLGMGTWGTSNVPALVATIPPDSNSQLPDTVVLTQIDSGHATTCAMDTASNVYCWGVGDNGQLGNGANNSSIWPVRVNLPAPPPGELTLDCPGFGPAGHTGTGTEIEGTPGSTLTLPAGPCTVTDGRDPAGGGGQWSVSAQMDKNFCLTNAPAVCIPQGNVTLVIPDNTITVTNPSPIASPGSQYFTNPAEGAVPTASPWAAPPAPVPSGGVTLPPLFGQSPPPPVASALLLQTYNTTQIFGATWDPFVVVKIPPDAQPTADGAEYLGTITWTVT